MQTRGMTRGVISIYSTDMIIVSVSLCREACSSDEIGDFLYGKLDCSYQIRVLRSNLFLELCFGIIFDSYKQSASGT